MLRSIEIRPIYRRLTAFSVSLMVLGLMSIGAQDRLSSMPGYAQNQKLQSALQGGSAFVSGNIAPSWAPDARSFTYAREGKTYRFDVPTLTSAETTVQPTGRGGGRGAPPAA